MATTMLTLPSTSRYILPFSCSSFKTVRYLSNSGFNTGENRSVYSDPGQRKSAAPIKFKASASASDSLMITAKTEVGRGIDLSSLLANVTRAALKFLRPRPSVNPTSSSSHIQRFIERVIIDCRFFTFFAVAGSLLGYILCFLEGCFLLLESYFKFFNSLSQKANQAHIMHLVIEAIDMFLVGTALLIFGVGLYAMFVGSKNIKEKSSQIPGSNLFGLFYLKTPPKWVEMGSVSQAQSRIGHAVMMVLQVEVLEKFNSIPVVTSLDLVCFAGAALLSSACIFLLSRLSASITAS
ncbi:hypothetical protein CUMW_044170 [Citrus unshiu]|uniref:uncharacterized protein LOC102611366 n=1 Tax=Citrus sinensis TaxID=2711 RepID=UPI000CBC5F79|nr:uncharacterized protein LOC102611366 [Citrus sinensis]GAY39412.1 hypothetical protein CUMW_044170 [Citrus unshiu]